MRTQFQNTINLWWHSIDRLILMGLAAIIVMGIFLIQAASPAVADRIHLAKYYFVERHIFMLIPSLLIMFTLSLLSPRSIRLIALLAFPVVLALIALTLTIGVEVKGATRWLNLPFGLSLQPSEFAKPLFVVVAAWLLTKWHELEKFPGQFAAGGLWLLFIALLLQQPDMGMTIVVTLVFFAQLFLAGLPWSLVLLAVAFIFVGGTAAYVLIPHVTSRVDRFLNPDSGDTYQISRALDAFQHGGLLGTGPAEGKVKMTLPDAHADFIFAVAGEELGLIVCLIIIALFAFVVLRGFWRAAGSRDLFTLLAVGGLLLQFGLQAFINMASSVHLIPTKGMTLPFISYGGSSLLALALAMGMVLALTRTRFNPLNMR